MPLRTSLVISFSGNIFFLAGSLWHKNCKFDWFRSVVRNKFRTAQAITVVSLNFFLQHVTRNLLSWEKFAKKRRKGRDGPLSMEIVNGLFGEAAMGIKIAS